MSDKLLSKTTPKARTEHPCGWCKEPIQPNEQYIRETCLGDGGIYTFCLHEECMTAEGDAWAYNEPNEDEPACSEMDIRGGGHERGKNCPECSDMPLWSVTPKAGGG